MAIHPFETLLLNILEHGEKPDVDRFGSASALLESSTVLGNSRLMPEFMKFALMAMTESSGSERDFLGEFVCCCLENATDDFVLIESVDLLDGCRPLPGEGDERCFARFLSLAADLTLSPLARAAGLDGAFRWAVFERRRQFRLLDFLLGIGKDDNPVFLARAAKIMGVAYSHWREHDLVQRLRELAESENANDEVFFELAMSRLTDGLEMNDRRKAAEAFEAARYWFSISSQHREQRPDAEAYVCCLDVLVAFSRGELYGHLEKIALSIADDAFQMDAWHADRKDPPWLGARHAESACWNMLALNLKGLSTQLDEISWWEPAVVVENHVLACYVAGRSILKRSSQNGIAALVRPRIESSLASREGQAHSLRQWLVRNADHEWSDEARELLQRVDALVSRELHDYPSKAAPIWPRVAELIDEARIPADAKASAQSAIVNAISLHLDHLSDAETTIIENCIAAVTQCHDYNNNSNGKLLFDAVLVWTVRFLNSRLEMTRQHDPGVAYLFEHEDRSLPKEDELQADYHRWMFSNVANTEIEISNVGGGRADMRFTCGGERLVVETKREKTDCSFDALEKAYSAQATDYQNVSIRLGLLLVLDQTERRIGGTPHISTLVRTSAILRKGETDPRMLVIVKVPGRRLLPSDLTKAAKKES